LKNINDTLIREKEQLMTELDLKLIEIQNLYQEKKDIMSENFRMAQEVQNMRFML